MGSCVRTESDQMARHDRSSLRLNDFAGERDNQGVLTIKPVNADMQSAHSYARGEFQCPEPDDTVAAPRPGGAGYRFVKRAFDICFSAGVCAVLAIPVVAVCAAICIDSPYTQGPYRRRCDRPGDVARVRRGAHAGGRRLPPHHEEQLR